MNLNDLKNFFGLHEKSFVPNVGIGTTNPAYPLDVVSDATAAIRVSNSSAAIYPALIGQSFGSVNPFLRLQSAAGTSTAITKTISGSNLGVIQFRGYDGSAWAADTNGVGNAAIAAVSEGTYSTTSYPAQLQFFTTPVASKASALRMVIDSAGDVGIGTTYPTTGTRLDITGTGAAASSILIPRDTVANRPVTGVNGMLRYASDTNKFEAYQAGAWVDMIGGGGGLPAADGSAAAPSIAFTNSTGTGLFRAGTDILGISTAGTQRMTLLANGKVGIGTTVPSDLFSVYGGNISLQNDNNWNGLVSNTAATNKYSSFSFVRSRGTIASPTYMQSGDIVGEVGFQNHTNTEGAALLGIATQTHTSSSAGTALAFWTIADDTNTAAEAARIDQNGNVGIGTDVPTSLLSIFGGDLKIQANAATWGAVLSEDAGSELTFNVAGAERMRIANNGSVGIGTDTPTSMLDVYSAKHNEYDKTAIDPNMVVKNVTNFQDPNTFATILLSDSTDNGSTTARAAVSVLKQSWNGRASDMTFQVQNSSGNISEGMRIDSTGNVGIGTTNPATTLDVNGQIKGGYKAHSSLNTNWKVGNIQKTSAAAGTLTFTTGSLQDGASYVLILTSAGTFTLSTAGDVTTWRCLPACASNQIVGTGHTILTILKAGTTGYVSWAAGY